MTIRYHHIIHQEEGKRRKGDKRPAMELSVSKEQGRRNKE